MSCDNLFGVIILLIYVHCKALWHEAFTNKSDFDTELDIMSLKQYTYLDQKGHKI